MTINHGENMQSYYIKLKSYYDSLSDVKPSQPYSYTYGDRPVFEFCFLPGEIAEGDTLVYAIDNDMVFYDSTPENLLHSSSCMVVVRHDVTAEEATAGKVQLRIETRTVKFRDVTNGRVRPVEVISGLYRRRGDGDDLNYVLLAKGRAFANGIIADYDALPEPITTDEYYTKGDIDGLLGEKADAATLVAHTDNSDIHVTLQDKSTWDSKADVTDIGNATVTITQGGVSRGAFSVNATDDVTIDLSGGAQADWNETDTTSPSYIQHKPDIIEAPAVAGTVGQVLTKTADGQEWKDFGIDDIVQTCQTLRDQTEAIYESVKATVVTYYVGPAYNYGVTVDGTMLSFTWTDPADNNVVKWARTRLVMKTGGFPANETDGTVLIDVTERNQHKTVPFTWDAGVTSNYYFALFTQTTGGVWNTGDECPRFTTDELTWATIAMMSRAGTLLNYPGMKIGSVVDKKVKDLYPKMRYMLADIDYSGSFAKVSDFMYDNTRKHNSIWIPYFLPSLGDGNSTATMMQFDAPESSYGATWDDVFITGKAYYTVSGESYTQLTAGTDYQDGESVADWQTLHGDTVYTKNHANRASYGNNIWKESNMRQWLNSTGNDWFQKQNEYDVRSGSTGYSSGWMTGFVPGFLELVMPVYNKTARNKVSSIAGGGGGGYDITLDKFWLLSLKEFDGSNNNNIAEGQQLSYFRDVATTNNQRIQYDEGGVARDVWLRSPNAYSVYSEHSINSSGASGSYSSSLAYAFQPAMCL